MISPRFRIADLVVLVLFAGLVAFTIREGDLFAVVPPIVFFGSVCIATVGRLYREGPRRAAWSTFALFGWVFIGFMILLVFFGGGNFDEEELMVCSAAGFLGAGFSAYVAGRLVPRAEPGSPPGHG